MNFRTWLEMAHIKLPASIDLEGQKILFIDFKFETYPPEFDNTKEWLLKGFAAKFSNNYIVFDGETGKTTISNNPQGFDVLPDWWIEKAYMSRG